MWAARRAAFFYPGPDGLLPGFDGGLIPLEGSELGFLVAPAQAVEQFAHVIAMIPNAQPLLDQIGDPLCGPQLGAIAVRPRPLRQEANQSLLLRRTQLGWAARGGLGLQPRWPLEPKRIAPTQNTAGMATDATGDLMQRKIPLQESDDLATTRFQHPRRSVRSHRGNPFPGASILLHYLCGSQ